MWCLSRGGVFHARRRPAVLTCRAVRWPGGEIDGSAAAALFDEDRGQGIHAQLGIVGEGNEAGFGEVGGVGHAVALGERGRGDHSAGQGEERFANCA